MRWLILKINASLALIAYGQIYAGDALLPKLDKLQPFISFCEQAWLDSLALVEEAKKKQQKRQ